MRKILVYILICLYSHSSAQNIEKCRFPLPIEDLVSVFSGIVVEIDDDCFDTEEIIDSYNCVLSCYDSNEEIDDLIVVLDSFIHNYSICPFLLKELVTSVSTDLSFNIYKEEFKPIFIYYVLNKLNKDVALLYNELETIFAYSSYLKLLMPYVKINDKTYYSKELTKGAEYSFFKEKSNTKGHSDFFLLGVKNWKPERGCVGFSKHTVLNDIVELSFHDYRKSYYKSLPKIDLGKSFMVEDYLVNKLCDYFKLTFATENITSEREQLLFILNFVQEEIEYKFDPQNDFYYPFESIMYGHGDCEDKSLLVAYMTKRILRLDCYLIVYDNHVNLGVNVGDKHNYPDDIFFKNKELELLVLEPSGSLTYNELMTKGLFENKEVKKMISLQN